MEKNIQTETCSEKSEGKDKSTNWLEVCHGVLAGLFGVQSQKNRERDFKRGNGTDYILVYAVMVVVLVIGMVSLVNIVIP